MPHKDKCIKYQKYKDIGQKMVKDFNKTKVNVLRVNPRPTLRCNIITFRATVPVLLFL